MRPTALTNELACILADEGWSTVSEEPEPSSEMDLREDGFFLEPPGALRIRRELNVAQPGRNLSLQLSVGSNLLSKRHRVSATPVVAHAYDIRTGRLASCLALWLFRASSSRVRGQSICDAVQRVSEDASGAFEAMCAAHVDQMLTLPELFSERAWCHLDRFEVSSKFRGEGLGAYVAKAVFAHLAREEAAALLSVRAYPLQYIRERALGTEYSHSLASESAYIDFQRAQRRLQRHYAKHLGAQRLPSTDYFVMSLTDEVVSLFNAESRRWMLSYRGPVL